MSAADRQARARARRAKGERVLRVPISLRAIETLYDLGLIADGDNDERVAIEVKLIFERGVATLRQTR
jgi:hypothetical protein